MYIPYGRQSINEADIQAVVEVLHSDYLTTGPKVKEFEEKVAHYVGVKYAVAISNGTAALHAACFAVGIEKGDEVITTPITFAASANAVLYCGGTPVFADIDKDTYNISPKSIREKITKRTKAIIIVHYTGQPCDIDEIHQIADEYHLSVIEDGAHALGAVYKGKKVGALSDLTTLSFHPVKHITTGEGGMVLTNQEELYKKLILFRTHGITREKEFLHNDEGDWYYEQLLLGYNYRISDLQCALGISQMDRLEEFLSRRREIAEKYNQNFEKIDNIIIPKQRKESVNSWHLYVLQVKQRKAVFEHLRKAGIGVNVHYIPVYHFPFYQQNGYQNVYCPNAEALYKNIISLPIYPELTQTEQDYVINQVIECVEEKK